MFKYLLILNLFMRGIVDAVTDKVAYHFSRTPRSTSQDGNRLYAEAVVSDHISFIERKYRELKSGLPGSIRCNDSRCDDIIAEELSHLISW